MKCIHCKRRKAARHRKGLCFGCGTDRSISTLYQSKHPKGRRGVLNGYINERIPDTPTLHEPGSDGKVAVMIDRSIKRQSLHHPHDRKVG